MSIDIAAPGGSQAALTAALRADMISGLFNDQTGTTYTLLTTDSCVAVTLNNASPITVTLPNALPVGFNCLIYQKGAGQVTLSPASGATLRNRNGNAKTAGQYAVCSLLVTDNSGGAAAVYVLAGDTSA